MSQWVFTEHLMELCKHRTLSLIRNSYSFIAHKYVPGKLQMYRRFTVHRPTPSFGLLFDIDGVIVRGRNAIPGAAEVFRKLLDRDGKPAVPLVFVTNAGNCLRQARATELGSILGVGISADQIILSHSPLQRFHHFHDKWVLMSGQGPMEDIAKDLGFRKVITIEDLRAAYPLLDMVDHNRRPQIMPRVSLDIPAIEVHFNKSNYVGRSSPLSSSAFLLQIQKFGHGTFLVCLETLYHKLTGQRLIYEALIGKPSTITYSFAEHLILTQAKERGWNNPIRTLYAIGDNPMADIYGANLYNLHLQSPQNKLKDGHPLSCQSILVCTGVYGNQKEVPPDPQETVTQTVFHGHRDFRLDPSLVEASYVVHDVEQAVDLVLKMEGWVGLNEMMPQ
uniref:Haloacid dehalogenase-like hydrolase domain-containing 5 n=1 Tax=Leptobrachium leishanense TaxID=445787 RepID=A0A8C5MZ21_9ANUR